MKIDKNNIVDFIKNYVKDSIYFEEPLVGFADANDPLFLEYKTIVGDLHWTPLEFLQEELSQKSFIEGTVISWVLPLKETVVESNRRQNELPSLEWAKARKFGEQFNNDLRKQLILYLQKEGYESAAPMLSERWQRTSNLGAGMASTWSERHAAFAAGLGTFSLNESLITEKGTAHRCGSIVSTIKVEPDKRPYKNPYEYCLFFQNNDCLSCGKRCKAGAITRHGHDKQLCYEYINHTIIKRVNDELGMEKGGCGLCQTGVPCSRQKP